jgi:alpha-D-ribose 1-methylphosphonate 5-phosphate C-P lyase
VTGYDVFCHICGQKWAEMDPSVRLVHGDGVWECSEESACFDRRAMRQLHQEVTGDGTK